MSPPFARYRCRLFLNTLKAYLCEEQNFEDQGRLLP